MYIGHFAVGESHYELHHKVDNDSREVRSGEDFSLTMVIDSSLRFTGPDGKIGDMCNEGGKWVFYFGPLRTRFDTGITVDTPHRSYCWEQLEKAEMAAAKHYLESLKPTFLIGADDTEGGSCD